MNIDVTSTGNAMPYGPEEERSQRIMDALKRFGWLATHFRPAWTAKGYRTALSGHKGFPDIVAVHRERTALLFVEVKADKKRPSEAQEKWLRSLFGLEWCMDNHPVGLKPFFRVKLRVVVCNSDEAERELLDFISDGRIIS